MLNTNRRQSRFSSASLTNIGIELWSVCSIAGIFRLQTRDEVEGFSVENRRP